MSSDNFRFLACLQCTQMHIDLHYDEQGKGGNQGKTVGVTGVTAVLLGLRYSSGRSGSVTLVTPVTPVMLPMLPLLPWLPLSENPYFLLISVKNLLKKAQKCVTLLVFVRYPSYPPLVFLLPWLPPVTPG